MQSPCLRTTVSDCLHRGRSARRSTLFRLQNLMSRASIAANPSPTNSLMGGRSASLPVDRNPMTSTRTWVRETSAA